MLYPKPPITVTVASSGTTSDAFRLGRRTICAIRTPTALTSTAITFVAATSEDGTYTPVHDSDGNEVSLVVATNEAQHVALTGAEMDALSSADWVKLVTGSSEGAARSFEVVLK